MTGIRRLVVATGLATAVVFAGGAPASAGFSESAPLATTTVSTGTVTPASRVEVKNVTCTTTVDPLTGAVTSTVTAMVEWWRSTNTPGITGYRVTAHLSNGTTFVMAQTEAATYETYGSAPQSYLAYSPRFSVTTLTSYGWTAESAKSAVLTC
jgi:hypothetical protein